MTKHGKRYLQASEKFDKNQILSFAQGIEKVKELAFAHFDESVDAHINLGIDPSKGDQVVRGSIILPHGTGKKNTIIVFAKGDHAKAAEDAGADYVGAEDIIAKIENGWLDFTIAVATPDMMGMVGKLAKILGPRGLLPNKKTGTVTLDIAAVVSDLKKGKVFFKNDKNGIIHFSFGRVSFDISSLKENFAAFIKALSAAKPPASKGKFIKKATIDSTMGVGIKVNPDEL